MQVFEVLHYVGSCLLKMVRTKMRSGKKPPDSSGDTGDPFLPCSNNNNNNNNSASEGTIYPSPNVLQVNMMIG